MKQMTNWLERELTRRWAGAQENDRHAPERVGPRENGKEQIGVSDNTPTQPTLMNLDKSWFETIETNGFDPYNSGSFDSSKSRSHK